MKTEGLGEWRRTAYSVEVTPAINGEKITLFGWVASIRRQGAIIFLILNDAKGSVQLVVKSGRESNELIEMVDSITEHSSIGVRGIVRENEKAPRNAEVYPEEIRILGLATKTPPFSLHGGKLPKIDKLLDIRAVALRRPTAIAIMSIRMDILRTIRAFFFERHYKEINTPKIISTATEGGASLFPLLYYDKEAFLTQSPQLFKEQLVLSFEKVFEIADAYRAEKSRTLHHLSEFISLDMEEAYVDYRDVMKTIESLLQMIENNLLTNCRDELSLVGSDGRIKTENIPRITYDEAIQILRKDGVDMEWGNDFSSASLTTIGKKFPSFFFITDWPAKGKPFYIKPSLDDLSESFDLMYGHIELASGGTRISSKKDLEVNLREKGLNPSGFEYHLRIFDYGMPPHAGFGLGFERLLMVLANQSNIREVSIFPRDQFRLSP